MNLTLGSALLLLAVGCFLTRETETLNFNEPVTPKDYRLLLGFGFATNWFKTTTPLKKYKLQNIKDVYDVDFRNLRLRYRAGLYEPPYTDAMFNSSLEALSTVVDDCISEGVFPVISWENHLAEAFATEDDQDNFVNWWTKVAEKLKDKNYMLSFNLYTELGIDVCQLTQNCAGSLKLHPDKYNIWTKRVVDAIRATGGNNAKRILMLNSKKVTAKGLSLIDKAIYSQDDYMMAEFHIYASGPNKRPESPKYWVGNGTTAQRQTLLDEIKRAKADIPLEIYFGAWMPHDNIDGSLTQPEVENFARYFVSVMKNEKMPTALNVLDKYYKTKQAVWRTDSPTFAGTPINVSSVFQVIHTTIKMQ